MQNQSNENKSLTKSVIIGIVVALVLGLVVYFFTNKTKVNSNISNNNSQTSDVVNNEDQNSDADKTRFITLEEIALHNSKESCWTAIDNNVYDVTSFTSKHKGGDRILAVCGIDGTDLFTGKSPMGRAHGDLAKMVLSSLKIGTLQK